jgi:hypothetical protein
MFGSMKLGQVEKMSLMMSDSKEGTKLKKMRADLTPALETLDVVYVQIID